MGRAPCCDKASVKRGPWSPEEDDLLRSYVQNHGTGGNWIALPHKAGLNRCGKSCRLRWLNYLRPDIKHGGYTEQEDRIICSLYSSIGSRWSIIASKLPGRTDNDVKNYWNTKLKKKALAIQNHHQHQQPQDQYYGHQPHQYRSAGCGRGRERREAFVAAALPVQHHQQSQQQQQCASSSMQPSPASAASSAVTTASGGDACSFGVVAMYPSPSAQQLQQTQTPAAFAPQQHAPSFSSPAALPTGVPINNNGWTTTAGGGVAALDDMFLPELLGAGEFPSSGDLFGSGFGPLLLQDRAAASLQELSACYYFPNTQAEMWADVKTPAGLCQSLT